MHVNLVKSSERSTFPLLQLCYSLYLSHDFKFMIDVISFLLQQDAAYEEPQTMVGCEILKSSESPAVTNRLGNAKCHGKCKRHCAKGSPGHARTHAAHRFLYAVYFTPCRRRLPHSRPSISRWPRKRAESVIVRLSHVQRPVQQPCGAT